MWMEEDLVTCTCGRSTGRSQSGVSFTEATEKYSQRLLISMASGQSQNIVTLRVTSSCLLKIRGAFWWFLLIFTGCMVQVAVWQDTAAVVSVGSEELTFKRTLVAAPEGHLRGSVGRTRRGAVRGDGPPVPSPPTLLSASCPNPGAHLSGPRGPRDGGWLPRPRPRPRSSSAGPGHMAPPRSCGAAGLNGREAGPGRERTGRG